MKTMVTGDILESYLQCKSKGYLKFVGQQGTIRDYEIMLARLQEKVSLESIDKILTRCSAEDVLKDCLLSPTILKQGRLFLLNAHLDYDFVSFRLCGLKRIDDPSKLGPFHYIPIISYGGWQPRKEQRLLLEIYGVIISRFQGRSPATGIIWFGKDCRSMTIRLSPDLRVAKRSLEELRLMTCSHTPPPLILNDRCPICEFYSRCLLQAIQEDNLSLLRNISEKEIKSLARKGILTLTQLSHTFRPRRDSKTSPRQNPKRYNALQALAIRDKRVYILGTPKISSAPAMVYLDVEGTPEGHVYLIGLLIVEDGFEVRHSLWASDKDEEGTIFEQFLMILSKHKDFVVFCYGGYEKTFIKRMCKISKRKKFASKVLNTMVNTLSIIYSHIYYPTYSNGLKDVGGYLGCTWSELDASGIQSIVWRSYWEANHDDNWKQKLITYNQEDCTALRRITELIQTIVDNSDSNVKSLFITSQNIPVSWMDIDKLSYTNKWQRINFYHSDYEFINNCAYFDYQRDRVYVRTSRNLRKSKAKEAKERSGRRPNPTNRVQIVSPMCPVCKNKEDITETKDREFKRGRPRVKRAFDLVFSSGGVKRRRIECRTYIHHCLNCDHKFVPDKYQRLDKHFHSLKSWSIYQHVTHRLSFRTIQSMIEELFGFNLGRSEIHMFKMLMAHCFTMEHTVKF